MATSVTFAGVTYSIPATGESGWGDQVSAFLIAVASNAMVNTVQTTNIRTSATASTAVGATDATVILSGTGDLTATLPVAVDGRIVVLVMGGAATKMTITPAGSDTINDAANFVTEIPRGAVVLQYKTGAPGNWVVRGLNPAQLSDVAASTSSLSAASAGTAKTSSRSDHVHLLPTVTADRAIVSSGAGVFSASAITATELNYLDNLDENIKLRFTDLNELKVAHKNTGVASWGGAGSYFSAGGSLFTLSRAPTCYIRDVKVVPDVPQNVTLTANKSYVIGISTNGTLTATDISTIYSTNPVTLDANWETYRASYCPIFLSWYSTTDGSLQLVSMEDHEVGFNSEVSMHLHMAFGQVFLGTGAILTYRDSTSVKIVGADAIDDHGLISQVSDGGGAAMTFYEAYINGSGVGVVDGAAGRTTFQGIWINSGVKTTLGTGRASIKAIYAVKASKNSSESLYFAVPSNSDYASPTAAANSIGTGVAPIMTQFLMPPELAALETTLMGFVLVEKTNPGGVIQIPTLTANGFTSGVRSFKKTASSSFNAGAVVTASGTNVSLDVASFNVILSSADVNAQLAFNTINATAVKKAVSSVDNEIARFDGTTGQLLQAYTSTGPTIGDTGILNINNTTDATSTTDGSLQTDGGLSVAKKGYFGSDVTSAGYFADTIIKNTGSNEIHLRPGVDADAEVYWAYKGYNGGVTRYRTTYFCDGKANVIGSCAYDGWTIGGTASTYAPLKIYSGTQNNKCVLIGNAASNKFAIANSGTATFRLTSSNNGSALIILSHDNSGASAIVHAGYSAAVTILSSYGGIFTTSAPGASQIQIAYANANSTITLTAGSSAGSNMAAVIISPAI